MCSELFSNHTHKHASVMPKPQSFTRNTDENRDILKNFTGVVFRQIEVCKKNLASPSRLNLLISQPYSYLQYNLFQAFGWRGLSRERSEQEKQRGGGVGGEREGENPSLSAYLSRSLTSRRTPLSESNAWTEQAICCMNNSTINCTERD